MIDQDLVNMVGMIDEEDVFAPDAKAAHVAIIIRQPHHETYRIATTFID